MGCPGMRLGILRMSAYRDILYMVIYAIWGVVSISRRCTRTQDSGTRAYTRVHTYSGYPMAWYPYTPLGGLWGHPIPSRCHPGNTRICVTRDFTSWDLHLEGHPGTLRWGTYPSWGPVDTTPGGPLEPVDTSVDMPYGICHAPYPFKGAGVCMWGGS
jgi:hypothetical protein